jgi:hypothetical protein
MAACSDVFNMSFCRHISRLRAPLSSKRFFDSKTVDFLSQNSTESKQQQIRTVYKLCLSAASPF